MKKNILSKPVLSSVLIFFICLSVRLFEYFVLKTDESFIAENFIHKVFGIVILVVLLKIVGYKLGDIGFKKEKFLKYLSCGLLLGAICFSVSYFTEFMIQSLSGKAPCLELYVNGFSLVGNEVKHTEIGFFGLCILMNIVNVIMEEGLFRGFFIKIINNKSSFFKANLIAALLFGVWHFVMPLRSFIYGEINAMSMVVMMVGYIILSGIMSIKWGLLYKMTGSLLIGIGDHLFNNVVATNLLHIVTTDGADEMQIIRILLAQVLSFAFVAIVYKVKSKKVEVCAAATEK